MSNCEFCGNQGIMVEIRGVYDGALFYLCKNYHERSKGPWAWHRWPRGTWQRNRAEPYVREARGQTPQTGNQPDH